MFNIGIPSDQKVRIREVGGKKQYFQNGQDVTEAIEAELKNKQLEALLPRYKELFGKDGIHQITDDNVVDSCFLSYESGASVYEVLSECRLSNEIDPNKELGFFPWMLALTTEDFDLMCEVGTTTLDHLRVNKVIVYKFEGVLYSYPRLEALTDNTYTDFMTEHQEDRIFFRTNHSLDISLSNDQLKASIEKGISLGQSRVAINNMGNVERTAALEKLEELWFIDADTDLLVKVNLTDPVFEENLYLDGDYFVTQVSKYKVKRFPIDKNLIPGLSSISDVDDSYTATTTLGPDSSIITYTPPTVGLVSDNGHISVDATDVTALTTTTPVYIESDDS